MSKKIYLVSACLLGINCRYNGSSSLIPELESLVNSGRVVPVCPEVLGGLNTPREACEIVLQSDGSKKVLTQAGGDCSPEFLTGAKKVLEICKVCEVKEVILKANSPSCGCGAIYDGTFSGKLIDGNGLTAELLIENGIKVYNENNWDTAVFE